MKMDKPLRHVVTIGFDDSSGSRLALRWAAIEAARRSDQLNIVQAVSTFDALEVGWMAGAGVSRVPAPVRKDSGECAERIFEAARDSVLAEHPALDIRCTIVEGDARMVLMAQAECSDLVVVGSRGRGPMRSLLLGSVAMGLVRHSTAPIAVVKGDPEQWADRIVVAIDGQMESRWLLSAGLAEAQRRSQPLTVLTCTWAPELGRQWLDLPSNDRDGHGSVVRRMLADMRGDFADVAVTIRPTRGRADQCLIDVANESGLLIVGRRWASVLDQIGLGSLASKVVEHARGVVLVVPRNVEEANDEC